MKPILIACLLLVTTATSCQIHWDQASHWTLYSYQGHKTFALSIDSLERYDNVPMNDDSMFAFVKSATILDTKAPLTWMGGYVVTCKVNGTVRKLELSNYGGYFYDERSQKYYQVPEAKIEEWLGYLQASYLALMKSTNRQPGS